jgi:hypothetical protein
MNQETKSKSNKPLTFWQRLKIAKEHRLATEDILKTKGFTFLGELCGEKKSNLSKLDNLIGYFHYQAGLPLIQISNDLALTERNTRRWNQNLLETLGVKPSNESPSN